jgi:hypothetical protein
MITGQGIADLRALLREDPLENRFLQQFQAEFSTRSHDPRDYLELARQHASDDILAAIVDHGERLRDPVARARRKGRP